MSETRGILAVFGVNLVGRSGFLGVTCGVDSLDAEGANFMSVPYCESVITRSLFMPDDLSYRSIGSIVQADLENAKFVRFYCCRIGIEYGSFSFGARSEAGIGNTSELDC